MTTEDTVSSAIPATNDTGASPRAAQESSRPRDEKVVPASANQGLARIVEALLTAEEVAGLLKVSLSMVYKLRRSGELPSVRVGALYRFNPDVVRAFMKGELRRRF